MIYKVTLRQEELFLSESEKEWLKWWATQKGIAIKIEKGFLFFGFWRSLNKE